MRPAALLSVLTLLAAPIAMATEPTATTPAAATPAINGAEVMIRSIYTEALTHGQAYDNLKVLVANYPGRLSGSPTLDHAITWMQEALARVKPDRVFLQDVMIPHWERGEPESVFVLDSTGTTTLDATALGGSGATAKTGLLADVIEVRSLDELATLGQAKLQGKIVFFNRPMDPAMVRPGSAYGSAGDQRTRGPAAAAKLGAVGALVRSLTQSHDDVPHTGVTIFPPHVAAIPAAALSTNAADRLSTALAEAKRAGHSLRVGMKVNAQTLPDAPSHNVIGEIKGTQFPNEVIVVGGHLDSWDIAPGAHDDGAGIVQSIEVLRIFRALGIQPRHTIRCVGFVNEENGSRGGKAYAELTANEKHLLALESDAGGFEPRSVRFGNADDSAAGRAARWLPLFRPYGVFEFNSGTGGTDVNPLLTHGAVVSETVNDSQRYFDIHHTRNDTLDKVNPRELHLGAAAMASLVWLVDTQGL